MVCALDGLKSSGAAWRSMIANTLCNLEYQSTRADPDVWINMITRPDGRGYFPLILIDVDEILHIHHDTKFFMNNIR